MTIDKQKLKALAEAATPGPWKKTIDGVMPEGRGFGIFGNFGATDAEENRTFIAAANPATILALLAEIDRLEAQVRLAGVAAEVTVHQEVGRAVTRELVLAHERDQLKAENEKLRREREGKVLCDLDLFETLRDSANTEADEHRQCMATYRPLRQENLDAVVKKCDDLLAALAKEASRG